jgi:Tfp pilus assembly protein PilF
MIRTFRIWVCFLAVTLVAVPSMAATSDENKEPEEKTTTLDTKGKTENALDLLRQGKLDAAEQILLQVLALTPDPARVYYELGRIHEQRGDSLKAIAAFKEGIKIHEQGRRKSP